MSFNARPVLAGLLAVTAAGCEGHPRLAASTLDAGAASDASPQLRSVLNESPTRSGAAPGPLTGFPAGYCARAGSGPIQRRAVALDIVMTYDATRATDCRTAGLTPEWNDRERKPWWDYLFGYTTLMMGCPLILGVVDGGILSFGPANVAAVGLPRPVLGRDDVAAIIGMYLDPFSAALTLSGEERAAVESFLWMTAERMQDLEANAVLSQCRRDAGEP